MGDRVKIVDIGIEDAHYHDNRFKNAVGVFQALACVSDNGYAHAYVCFDESILKYDEMMICFHAVKLEKLINDST